jgi:uncharacterized iron-regulated protein
VLTSSDTVSTVSDAAVALGAADVVVLGEMHRSPAVHELHHELLRALHARRGNLVIAMEMFDRDVQTVLLQYLAGMVHEDVFLQAARPWPRYRTDYRPVVEFAKQNGILVLAANAPKELVRRVAMQGIDSVAGERHIARETSAPEDEYWDAFVETMQDDGAHVTAHGGSLQTFYQAQCLRDDTMAETVVDHLQARRAVGDRPLCVLICGRGHSDFGRGTVARIKSRMPGLDVRVLSTELVDDLGESTYSVPRAVGDYVVVAEGEPEHARAAPKKVAAAEERAVEQVARPVAGTVRPVVAEEPPLPRNPEGLRPALGLMPDYGDAGGGGVLVSSLREGGSAELAGIEVGDYIVKVGSIDVVDVQSYTEALDEQLIGKTITVRVRRDEAMVDLQVKVGSRTSH